MTTTNLPVFNKQVVSDDFINLSEPPRPKDSPNVSEFATPRGTLKNDNRVPRTLHRRTSTNYVDALNLKEMDKPNVYQVNTYEENKHYTPTYGHNPSSTTPVTTHNPQYSQQLQGYSINSTSTIDMGDHVQHQRDTRAPSLPSLPSSECDYLEENDRNAMLPCKENSKGYTAEDDNSKPNLYRRRSSFQYEDFKKDIYDKLKFFER